MRKLHLNNSDHKFMYINKFSNVLCLVTMKWWDDLWLNEGFASFVAFKGSAHVHPDWDMVRELLIK